MKVCFLCNKTSMEWYENLAKTKSTHSATAISELIKSFLNESESCRNVDNETNCVCSGCFEQISYYDFFHTKATEQETKFKRKLLATEVFLKKKQIKIKEENDIDECDNEYIFDETGHWGDPDDHIESDEMLESKPTDFVEVLETKVNVEILEREPQRKFDVKNDTELNQDRKPPTQITVQIESPLREGQDETSQLSTGNSESVVETLEPDKSTVKVETLVKKTLKPSDKKPNRNIPCRICEQCGHSVSIKSYRFHLRDHRRRVQKASLKSSLKSSMKSSSARECDICKNGISLTPKQYEIHMRNKHGDGVECELCGHTLKSTDIKLTESKHRKWHDENPKLMCVVCRHNLQDTESLKTHVKLHANRPKCQCLMCDKIFPTLHRLRVHVDTHGERNKLCEECGKAFSTQTGLLIHKVKHKNDPTLKCPKCPKEFKRHKNLKAHLNSVHSDDRPFSCSFFGCDMKFKRKANLKVHERRHTEDTKTEKCPQCSASFEHKFHLQQHLLRKHIHLHKNRPKSECLICGKVFKNLKQHMKCKHAEPTHSEVV